tara:strand:+ start:114 stop:575 length:462 start_codon:yes stop_codon:yes gene_type:complete
MNNQLKFKTRIAFIQVVFQYLSNKADIMEILNSFIKNYKGTYVDSFYDKKKMKFEFNSNFLNNLINSFVIFINSTNFIKDINQLIEFDRKFEKWDIINQSILLCILSEIKNNKSDKVKIILNDYINVSKLFVSKAERGLINAITDKIICDEKK